jgi:hypothetical protein
MFLVKVCIEAAVLFAFNLLIEIGPKCIVNFIIQFLKWAGHLNINLKLKMGSDHFNTS